MVSRPTRAHMACMLALAPAPPPPHGPSYWMHSEQVLAQKCRWLAKSRTHDSNIGYISLWILFSDSNFILWLSLSRDLRGKFHVLLLLLFLYHVISKYNSFFSLELICLNVIKFIGIFTNTFLSDDWHWRDKDKIKKCPTNNLAWWVKS